MKNLQDLKNAVKQTQANSEIMEGRDKGDMSAILNLDLTIIDYDFLSGDNGEYTVLLFQGEDKHFFFGGKVITDLLKELDTGGFKETIQTEGLPVQFSSKKSKKGRFYTNATLFPNEQ